MHPRSIHHVFPYHVGQIADDEEGWWAAQRSVWPVAAALAGRFAASTEIHVIGDRAMTDPQLSVHRGSPAGPGRVPFGCDVSLSLLRTLRALGPHDVCVLHGSDLPAGSLCAEAARRSAIVAVYHGGATGGPDRLKDLAARHLVLRPEVAATLVEDGYDPSTIHEVTPSIDGRFSTTRRRPPRPGHAVLGWVGRPTWGKGVDALVPTVRQLVAEGIDVEVDLVGATHLDDVGRLGGEVSAAGAELVSRGYVPNCELPELMATWDVLLFPSRWEGFGRSPAEAAAMGLPVVAVEGVLPDRLVDGEMVRAVPRDAFGAAVLAVLTHPPASADASPVGDHAAGAAVLDEIVLGLPDRRVEPRLDCGSVVRQSAAILRRYQPLLAVAGPVKRSVERVLA